MAQACEAAARYHELLGAEPYRDLAWAELLQDHMRRRGLTKSGRLITPVLRPHFLTKVQFAGLARAAERLASILDKLESAISQSPAMLARMQMLPAEKMLAALPPGYPGLSVTSQLDAHLQNGSLQFRDFHASNPVGLPYSDALADLFLDLPLVKEFEAHHYKISKLGQQRRLLAAILESWKAFGGHCFPSIAVLQSKHSTSADTNESQLLSRMLTSRGQAARVVSPDQLEYYGSRLRSGDFEIDIVFRRIGTQDLLSQYDWSHPLLVAYREHTICLINSFRSEIAQRRALFDLLTDDRVTASLPSSDRKLLHEFVPWTRIVAQTKTKLGDREIDLPEYILRGREHLTLLPNQDCPEHRSFVGSDMDQPSWERALRTALRHPYVVQEQAARTREVYPVYEYGELQMRELDVFVCPHTFNGKVQGASAILCSSSAGFSSRVAIAPVLLSEAI